MERKAKAKAKATTTKRRKKAEPVAFQITAETAPKHLASLFAQLNRVFKDGKIDLDRLNRLAHW